MIATPNVVTLHRMTIHAMHNATTPSGIVAAEIRAEMARQRITMRELGRMIGIDKKWVSRRLGTGESELSVDDVELIARHLHVSPDKFIRAWLTQLPGLDSNQQPAGYQTRGRRTDRNFTDAGPRLQIVRTAA